jgi:hypothetical protein
MNRALIKRLSLILALSAGSLLVRAQDSLGDIARQNRSNKPAASRSKVVIDEESNSIRNKSPFPNLVMTGLDNTDEIVRAMESYRGTHNPGEFESAVHAWFDDYDSILEKAINEQIVIKDRRMSRTTGPQFSSLDRSPNDYKQYEQRRLAEARAVDDDRRRYEADGLTCARIQQAFGRIRNYLTSKNLKYEWFKIRFGNGNGSW